MIIRIKRIYEPAEAQDGYRVLVDRIWPRGVRKQDAAIDLWLRDAAPSTVLRNWFSHLPERWDKFKIRYFAELDDNRQHIQPLLKAAKEGNITLIYSSRDQEHNQAVALREYIEKLLP